jgi:nicotinate-nucleotide--dimethylbenzimidazole phosphoribosyltransferase
MKAKVKPISHSPQDFADILEVINRLPEADAALREAANEYASSAKLAEFPAELLAWMATHQGRFPPRLLRPRIVLFASDCGIAGHDFDTRAEVAAILEGRAPIYALAEGNDTDVRLYELNLQTPTADFSKSPSMSEAECVGAIIYGMMAVEAGLDVILLRGFGKGADIAAAEVMQRLKAVNSQPLEILRRAGGRDMAAMLGVMIAARMAKTPVVIEGVGALATAALLHRLAPDTATHCFFASTSEASSRMAAELGLMQATTEGDDEIGMASIAILTLLRAAALVKS